MRNQKDTATGSLLHSETQLETKAETAETLYDLAERMAAVYRQDPRHYSLLIWAGAEEGWAAHQGYHNAYELWVVPITATIPAGAEWNLTHALLYRTEMMAAERLSRQSSFLQSLTHAGVSVRQ